MANTKNNDVVIVELDRPRVLRFGHKSLKIIMALSRKEDSDDPLEQLEDIELVYFHGLQQDAKDNGETLSLEDMEDILNYAESMDYLAEKMEEAMYKAMGKMAGNGQQVGKPRVTTRNRSTGKSR